MTIDTLESRVHRKQLLISSVNMCECSHTELLFNLYLLLHAYSFIHLFFVSLSVAHSATFCFKFRLGKVEERNVDSSDIWSFERKPSSEKNRRERTYMGISVRRFFLEEEKKWKSLIECKGEEEKKTERKKISNVFVLLSFLFFSSLVSCQMIQTWDDTRSLDSSRKETTPSN